MSDAIDRHIDHVRELTRRGGPLDPRGASASVRNPAWFLPDGTPTSERRELQAAIRAELRAGIEGVTERSHHAFVLAGAPGAGKSSLRRGILKPELAGHLQIDVDDIKSLLVERADHDQSLDGFLKPPEVKALEAGGEAFYPLELSALVHLEAGAIADVLRGEVVREGLPVVVDGVLSDADQAVALGRELEHGTYTIDVVALDVPFEVSENNIRKRWREAYERTLEGGSDLLGGRWVPSDYARFVFDGPDGRSKPVAAAERLAHEVGAVERLRVFRTPAIGAATDLATDLGRVRPDRPLLDGEAARAYQSAFGRGRARPPRPPQRDTGYGR